MQSPPVTDRNPVALSWTRKKNIIKILQNVRTKEKDHLTAGNPSDNAFISQHGPHLNTFGHSFIQLHRKMRQRKNSNAKTRCSQTRQNNSLPSNKQENSSSNIFALYPDMYFYMCIYCCTIVPMFCVTGSPQWPPQRQYCSETSVMDRNLRVISINLSVINTYVQILK